jgi:hypothetical protein
MRWPLFVIMRWPLFVIAAFSLAAVILAAADGDDCRIFRLALMCSRRTSRAIKAGEGEMKVMKGKDRRATCSTLF